MNKNRKLTAFLVAVFALVLAVPTPASAAIEPTLTVTPSCEGLTVQASYFQQPRTVRTNNRITVIVDGVSQTRDFGTILSPAIVVPWSFSEGHTYTVIVDANRYMGLPLTYDKLVTGAQSSCAS